MAKKRRGTPPKAVATTDAYSNPAARLGFGTLDLMQATSYPLTRLTQNYQLLTSLYRDNWIAQNIVSTIPRDIVRKWYEVKSDIGPEYLDELAQLERKTRIRQKVLDGMCWGRLYGGAAGIILIKGQDDLSLPLELDAVMPDSFLGLEILDRWSGVFPEGDIVRDPADPDFGLPEFYTIRDEASGVLAARVHHSRVVRFAGRQLPWLEQVTEIYWGESELESVYSEIVRRDNAAANIAALIFRANIDTIQTEGLTQLIGGGNAEAQRRFYNTLAAQSVMESNFGKRVIDKEDSVTNTQYSFGGLPEVYDRIMMDVAGAARTPVTKLFGRSPAGLNATGESDLQNYYDYLDGLRESDFRPVIERLLPVMALSAWGVLPDDLDISFPPLSTPDAKEVAEIAKAKAETVVTAYQAGLLNVDAAQKELKKLEDETGLFGSISDEDIAANAGKTYQDATALRDPLAGLGFEGRAMDGHPTCDYSPNQPRDRYGRWTSGGAGFTGGHREESGYDLTDEEKTTLVRQDTGMSEEEASRVVSAINDYTLEGYPNIRGAQATGESGQYLDEAEAIERYIDAAPKFGDGDLYRGMSVPSDFAETIHVGDVIDNGGALSSWSSNENVADNFAVPDAWGGKSAVMVIEGGTQRGTSIKHLSANGRDEDEVLIPASARYEITDIFDGDTVYVYLKEVE